MAEKIQWSYGTTRSGDLIVSKADGSFIEADERAKAERAAREYMAAMYRGADAKPSDFTVVWGDNGDANLPVLNVRVPVEGWSNP